MTHTTSTGNKTTDSDAKRQRRIFVSGPYTLGDVAVNVRRAMDWADILIDRGYVPYVPHLSHFMHINNPRTYEEWIRIDNAWLLICDGVLRIQGESAGADNETFLAVKNGIPVFQSVTEMDNYWRVNKC